MPLEAATYVQDLVITNPVGATDPKSDGDNHLRLIKQVLKTTFPDANGVVRFSTFIKTLLDDADAVTARATLGAGTSSYVDPLTTRGDLLIRNAANVTSRLAVGAATRFLRSDGNDPSWAQVNLSSDVTGTLPLGSMPDFDGLTLVDNPASTAFIAGTTAAATNRKFRLGEVGGWCALEQQSAAASATLDFVLSPYTTDFEDFEFIASSLIPATDAVNLWVRFSTDGGATYDAGASTYSYGNLGEVTGALTSNNSNADTHMEMNCATLGNTAGEEFAFRMMLVNPSQTTKRTQAIWSGYHMDSVPRASTTSGGGARLANQDTDAVRFMMSTGAITSGKIVMMGRRKVLL